MTAWAHSDSGTTAQALLYVHDAEGANTVVDGPRTPSPSGWEQFTAVFAATSTGKVRIHLYYYTTGSGRIYWDDVQLRTWQADFEPGSPGPWIPFGSTTFGVSGAQARSGSYSLAETGLGWGGVYQDLSGLIPGQRYLVKAWARSSAGTAGQAILWVHDTANNNVASDVWRTPFSSIWEPFFLYFTATSTGRIRIHLHYTGGTGTIYWDDLSLTTTVGSPLMGECDVSSLNYFNQIQVVTQDDVYSFAQTWIEANDPGLWANLVEAILTRNNNSVLFGPAGRIAAGAPVQVRFPGDTGSFRLSDFGAGGYRQTARHRWESEGCGMVQTLEPTYSQPYDGRLLYLPPSLTSLSPAGGVRGSTVNVTISGYGLRAGPEEPVSPPAVSGSGVTTAIISTSDTAMQASFAIAANAQTGTRNLTVTANNITTNSLTFTVGDPTPVISLVQPLETLYPGGQAWYTIWGANFGGCPTLSGCFSRVLVCPTGSPSCATSEVTAIEVNYWGDNQVNVRLSATTSAAGSYDVELTSAGITGLGFVQVPGGPVPMKSPPKGTVPVVPCDITIPNNGQKYSLGGDYLTTMIHFAANSGCSGTVNWTVNFSYQTSGGKGFSTAGPYTGSSALNSTWNFTTPEGVGGKGDVSLSITANGTSLTRAITVYVDGTSILDQTITDRLVALYVAGGGATPNLLTGIAMQESSYFQFAESPQLPTTLYGLTGRWPHESFDGGSHIGLMMPETTMSLGYSWLMNTAFGANLFLTDKITAANNYVAGQRTAHQGLRALTAVELEHEALVHYRFGTNSSTPHYFTASFDGTIWDWVLNTTNTSGREYADGVFAQRR